VAAAKDAAAKEMETPRRATSGVKNGKKLDTDCVLVD